MNLKQYKYLIALTLSNASDYICIYFHPLVRKIWKYFFWKLKNLIFFWNCSKIVKKSLFFNIFGNFSFLNRTLGLRKSFLNQTTYVLKNWLYQQSFLNQDSFLNRAFLNRDSTVLPVNSWEWCQYLPIHPPQN